MGRSMLEAQETQGAHRIPGFDRPGDPVGAPERRPSVPKLVTILDVVVNERVVVEDLDGNGSVESVLDRRALADRDAHHHLRSKPLAAACRPVRCVTEMSQKTIGDLCRSPISGNPFFEGALEALGERRFLKQRQPAPPCALRPCRRASPESTPPTSSPRPQRL